MKRIVICLLAACIAVAASAQTARWISVDDTTRNDRNVWIEFRKDFDL